jgi:hypothetical protein
MINIRKDYFATTLLDNLHLAVNSDDRQEGELLPTWGKLCKAVTVRYALLDVSTSLYEAVKKVDLSAVPSSVGVPFEDWVGFKYSSRNETSYLQRYVDAKTGGLLPQTSKAPTVPSTPTTLGMPRSTSLKTVGRGQPALPRSASLNTTEQSQNGTTPKPALKPSAMPHMNDNVQKTMRIKQWQEEVGSLRQEVNGVKHEDESKLPEFLRSPDYGESRHILFRFEGHN